MLYVSPSIPSFRTNLIKAKAFCNCYICKLKFNQYISYSVSDITGVATFLPIESLSCVYFSCSYLNPLVEILRYTLQFNRRYWLRMFPCSSQPSWKACNRIEIIVLLRPTDPYNYIPFFSSILYTSSSPSNQP